MRVGASEWDRRRTWIEFGMAMLVEWMKMDGGKEGRCRCVRMEGW